VKVDPEQGSPLFTVKVAEPEHPLLFFAVIVYVPAPSPEKFPDDWNAPPLMLNVKPLLPVADAATLPLFCPGPPV
jgi:hypothetical protein